MKRALLALLVFAALTQGCTARTALAGALVGITAAAVIAEAVDDDDHEARSECSCRHERVRYAEDDYGYDRYDR